MRNLDSIFKKSALAVAMGGALFGVSAVGDALLGTTASAQAQGIILEFCPGCSDGAANVNRQVSGTKADIDSFETLDRYTWTSVNNVLPAPSAKGFDDNHQWFINGTDTDGDGFLEAGDSFTESFTMRLINTTLAGEPSELEVYGVDSTTAVFTDNTLATLSTFDKIIPTHVFMSIALAGTFDSTFSAPVGPQQLGDLAITYSSAAFLMFFDADGLVETVGDQTLIAKFGTESAPAPGTGDGTTSTGIASLVWQVNWDDALAGVFRDEFGSEIAGADGDLDGLGDVSDSAFPTLFKLTTQAVILEDCRDGAFAAVSCNGGSTDGIVRLRLETQGNSTDRKSVV